MVAIKEFIQKCTRVWHILTKPTAKEYKTVSKVSALGIVLIGLLGFVISIALKLIAIFR